MPTQPMRRLWIVFLLSTWACHDNGPKGPALIVVTPIKDSLTVGSSVQLTDTVKDSRGSVLTAETVTWSSSDSSKARVTSAGVVTAVAPGAVTITATCQTIKGTAAIVAWLVPVASVIVTPNGQTMPPGGTIQLSVVLRDAKGAVLTGRAVTWVSNNPRVASVSSSGVVTALAVGTDSIIATSEGVSSAVVVSVVQAEYSIVDAQFTQSIQAADGSIPMILGGNAAAVNVLVRSTNALSPAFPIQVVLRLYSGGALVLTDTGILASSSATPTYDSPSAQILVPASSLTAGLQWQVVLDPKNKYPDDSAMAHVFPRTGLASLATTTVAPFNVRIIPIAITSSSIPSTGTVTSASVSEYLRLLQSAHPLGSVSATIGTVFTTTASFGTPPSGGASAFWAQVLSELDAARVIGASDPTEHWYGVIMPPRGFTFTQVGGIAYIPFSGTATGANTRTALGTTVGWANDSLFARNTFAHELGHNFGRFHSPCGNPANIDPKYPFAAGFIGLTGTDVFSWATYGLAAPPVIISLTGDLMGYCSPTWTSEYTYRGVMAFRGPGVVAGPPAASQTTRVLLVRGSVDSTGVHLEPALVLNGHATQPERSGAYTLVGHAGDGRELFRFAFEPAVLDHATSYRHFAFAIPATADIESAMSDVEVSGPAGLARLDRPAGAPAPAFAIVAGAGAAVRQTSIGCGSTARGVAVLDAITGNLLAISSTSSTVVPGTSGRRLTIVCSDGVRSSQTTAVAP